MAKRRLTKQQKRRIASNQEDLAKTGNNAGDNNIFSALVVSHHGRKIAVETDDGQHYSCKLRQNLGDIACGDYVTIEVENNTDDDPHAVVVAINDRRNLLEKTGFADRAKAVAANIGQVVIVCSVDPEPNPYLIDRYLVATENLNASALIVINKFDVINEQNKQVINELKNTYEKIGYRVIATSTKNNTGIDLLKDELSDTTSIFVGLSGVGKSSLVKKILPEHEIKIGAVSTSTGEGKHTTTVSSLYHLPCGGSLIDSPGVRDFTPRAQDHESIIKGFIELTHYRGFCKFSNCTHTSEPGCAIIEALEKNELSQQRINSFRKMINELES